MTERLTKPADFDDLHWGDGVIHETIAQPDPSTLDAGYPNAHKPPSGEWNWLFNVIGRIKAWLDAAYVREFGTLAEGVNACDPSYLFRVHPPIAGMYARESPQWSNQITGSPSTVAGIACDGRYVYHVYFATNGYVKAWDLETGSEQWSYSLALKTLNKVAADGRYVYAWVDTTADPLLMLDPSDGTLSDRPTVALSATATALVANGMKAVACAGNYAEFFDADSPGYDGQYDHGAALNAAAIDDRFVYVGGSQGTASVDVRALILATRAMQWGITLPTSSPAVVRGLACDGERVYVATDRVALTAGGNAALFCLAAGTGSLLWSRDSAGSGNILSVACDDHYVYTNESGYIGRTSKTDGLPLCVTANAYFLVRDCDGVSLYGVDGSGQDYVARLMRGGCNRIMMRTDGSDPNRRPFHKLAIPVSPL